MSQAVAYYLGKSAADTLGNLDVPVSNGEIVSINLVDELPEDPNELVAFLDSEKCDKQYWIAVAQAYAQTSRLDESLLIINKALSLPLFSPEDKLAIRSFLGWLYLKFVAEGVNKQENLIKASQEINTADDYNSTEVSSFLAKAILHLHQDQADKALVIFDKLLKQDNTNCFAILGKANIILSKTKNYASALKLFQQVLLINPLFNPDPRIGVGLCFWFLKDQTMAIRSWKRALEINPNNTKARILLVLSDFNNALNRSLTDDEFRDNYTHVLTQVSQLYADNKSNPVILLTLASYYFSKRDFDVVEKLASKVIQSVVSDLSLKATTKLSPFQSNLLSQSSFWLGRIAFAKGQYTQSQKHFHESIKFNENNLAAKLGLGQSQIGRGSIEEATITYESILKTNTKCLEVNYSLGALYAQNKSRRKQEQAIQILEKYVRLSNSQGVGEETTKEPVALNAYLLLSKLYETRDVAQSLNYLSKAIELRKQIGQDAPLEVYNNIGVFNFLKNNQDTAAEYFQVALDKAAGPFTGADGDELVDLKDDLKVSLSYNLARSKELVNQAQDSIAAYEQLVQECPQYFSAKLRLLFLDSILTNKSSKEEIKAEIDELLSASASNLEIRSFYGWFVKNFAKKIGSSPDANTAHHKSTLVDHDSHDLYALISLANIYCVMARDVKGQDDKKKKYYIRAVELFAKVLSVDPKNVYAAQGLAIVYIENKELTKGLDILRKIRDSLNDVSVYLNLGHVLAELKQYTKSIENYEIALGRFANGSDSKIFSFLGRVWYLRGTSEKNLDYLKKGLEYASQALLVTSKSSLKFNKAYIQFQIADFISKLPLAQRSVEDINDAITNLNEAIATFNELASDDEQHPPYPKSELKARANLGTSTLLTRLNNALEETEQSIAQANTRLEEAKKLREEEAAAKLKLEEERLAAIKAREEELAKERAILQEQAQQWAEEARANVIVDDDEVEFEEGEKKKKKGKAKGKKGKKRKAKDFINDSDEASAPSDSETEEKADKKVIEDDEDDEPEPESKKRVIDDDEDDDVVANGKKRKVDDDDIDGLFDEE